MTGTAQAEQPLFHEICPFRIGSRVRVNPSHKYAADWANHVFVVVGIRWDYQKSDGSQINVSIATESEIIRNFGATDGWRPSDLIPA